MRVQASRRKREATEATATQDAWAQHVAEQSMAKILTANAAPRKAPPPKAPPVKTTNRATPNNVSENGTNSHDAAFETWLSAQCQGQTSEPPDDDGLLKAMRKAIAGSRLPSRESPANSRESPARAA
jgi:hypothetical protein